jgi:CRP/FNR family transcriptional regulator, transcriptional activator FtrB
MERYGLQISGDLVEVTDAAPLRARFNLDPQIDGPEPIVPLPLRPR